MNKSPAKLITLKEVETMRTPLPGSWKKAAGLLRHKRKALSKHVKSVRLEWNRKSA